MPGSEHLEGELRGERGLGLGGGQLAALCLGGRDYPLGEVSGLANTLGLPLRGSDQTTLENFPPLSAQILCPSRISKPRRPPPPHLTLSLEAIYHYLQLGLVLPEVPEVLLFLLWVVLTDPLR